MHKISLNGYKNIISSLENLSSENYHGKIVFYIFIIMFLILALRLRIYRLQSIFTYIHNNIILSYPSTRLPPSSLTATDSPSRHSVSFLFSFFSLSSFSLSFHHCTTSLLSVFFGILFWLFPNCLLYMYINILSCVWLSQRVWLCIKKLLFGNTARL